MSDAKSTQTNIIIDEEFRLLLPLLSPDVKAQLEASLLEHGVRDAFVVWKGHDILVDGHNRYEIAMRHGLPFSVAEMEFASREEVIVWMLRTQMSRRNMTPYQTSYSRGLLYRTERKIHGGNREKRSSQGASSQNGNLVEPGPGFTARLLADEQGVSRNTLLREATFSEGIDALKAVVPEVKQKIISGEAKISRKRVQELATAPSSEVRKVARSIEDGSFVARPVASSQGDGNQQNDAPVADTSEALIAVLKVVDEYRGAVLRLSTQDQKAVTARLIEELTALHASM